jgi:hypothetical protein
MQLHNEVELSALGMGKSFSPEALPFIYYIKHLFPFI